MFCQFPVVPAQANAQEIVETETQIVAVHENDTTTTTEESSSESQKEIKTEEKSPSPQFMWFYSPRRVYLSISILHLFLQSARWIFLYWELNHNPDIRWYGVPSSRIAYIWGMFDLCLMFYYMMARTMPHIMAMKKSYTWVKKENVEGYAMSEEIVSMVRKSEEESTAASDSEETKVSTLMHPSFTWAAPSNTTHPRMQIDSSVLAGPIHCCAVLLYNEPLEMVADLVADVLAQPTRGTKVLVLGMEKGTKNKEAYISRVQELIDNHNKSLKETGLAPDEQDSTLLMNMGEYSGIQQSTSQDLMSCSTAASETKREGERYSRSISHFLYTVHELRDGEIAGTGSNHFQTQVAAEQFFPKELHNNVIFTKLDANVRMSRNCLAEIESCYSTLSENERLGATYFPPIIWTSPEKDANRTMAEFTVSNFLAVAAVGIVDYQMSFVSGSLKGLIQAGYTCASLLPEDENLHTRKIMTIPSEYVKTYRVNACALKLFFPIYVDKETKKMVKVEDYQEQADLEAGEASQRSLLAKKEKTTYFKEVTETTQQHITSWQFLTQVFLPKAKRWQLGNCENVAFTLHWLFAGPKNAMKSMLTESSEKQTETEESKESKELNTLTTPSFSQKWSIIAYNIDNTFRYYLMFSALQMIPMFVFLFFCLIKAKYSFFIPMWVVMFIDPTFLLDSIKITTQKETIAHFWTHHMGDWDRFLFVSQCTCFLMGICLFVGMMIIVCRMRTLKKDCFPAGEEILAKEKSEQKRIAEEEQRRQEEDDIETGLLNNNDEQYEVTLARGNSKFTAEKPKGVSRWDIGLEYRGFWFTSAILAGPSWVPPILGFYIFYSILKHGITNTNISHKAVSVK